MIDDVELEDKVEPTEEPAEEKREIMSIDDVMILLDFDGDFEDLASEDKALVKEVYDRFNRVII